MEIILQYFSELTPVQLEQFQKLDALYRDWNAKINVISRKDIDSLYLKHVLHSLSIAAIFNFRPGMEVIDIGCGGGFPSIPLAIFFPDTHFHAVDSINKKLTVVKEVAQGAGIKNISVQHSRAEDIRDRKFDVAISRAVAPLKDLVQWSKHLLKKPGSFPASSPTDRRLPSGLICLKGGDLAQEIHDSGKNPTVWEIGTFFMEPFFKEKFVLRTAP